RSPAVNLLTCQDDPHRPSCRSFASRGSAGAARSVGEPRSGCSGLRLLPWPRDGCRLGEAVTMAKTSKSYAVREAGPASRPGRLWNTSPCSLRSLREPLDDARLRSINGGPQVVTVVTGQHSQPIRRYEHGSEAWSASATEILREDERDPPG